PAFIYVEVVVIVTSNRQGWEACTVDFQILIFKPIRTKNMPLNFSTHLQLACTPLFLRHTADHFHVFNERRYLVGDDKQQQLVFLYIRQIGESPAQGNESM